MLMLMTGSAVPFWTACWYWLSRLLPMSKDVKATGIVGTIRFPEASTKLPTSTPVRPGLPSLKMITPEAPAAWALRTFTPKLQAPRWIRAIRPGRKLVKSFAVQPLDELEVGVGGTTMPPAG